MFQQLMRGRKHAPMKNSADEDATPAGFVKDDMLALLDPAKARMDCVACPSKARVLSDLDQATYQTVEIQISLLCTPYIGCIVGNIGEVQFG